MKKIQNLLFVSIAALFLAAPAHAGVRFGMAGGSA